MSQSTVNNAFIRVPCEIFLPSTTLRGRIIILHAIGDMPLLKLL